LDRDCYETRVREPTSCLKGPLRGTRAPAATVKEENGIDLLTLTAGRLEHMCLKCSTINSTVGSSLGWAYGILGEG
jgi:hypothetical protein